jgi:hypothetical protein
MRQQKAHENEAPGKPANDKLHLHKSTTTADSARKTSVSKLLSDNSIMFFILSAFCHLWD